MDSGELRGPRDFLYRIIPHAYSPSTNRDDGLRGVPLPSPPPRLPTKRNRRHHCSTRGKARTSVQWYHHCHHCPCTLLFLHQRRMGGERGKGCLYLFLLGLCEAMFNISLGNGGTFVHISHLRGCEKHSLRSWAYGRSFLPCGH